MLKVFAATASAFVLSLTSAPASNSEPDPEVRPEVALGERLFREHRFSQFFFANSASNPNKQLPGGDPVLDMIEHFDGTDYPSPFSGEAMSCASCHMVNQANEGPFQLGTRLYADFSPFSPIPTREDGNSHTLRNSQSVILPVNKNGPNFFHWDGEFNSLERLVVMGFGGRNMGWDVREHRTAHHHLFDILRGDDGLGSLAQEFGGLTYQEVFLSEDPLIPAELRLPENLRLDLSTARPHDAMMLVGFLVAEYMRDSQLSKDLDNNYDGSPYDMFLRKNDLPLEPAAGESDLEYSQRLLAEIESLDLVQFVSRIDDQFESHDQDFSFGPDELKGLLLFLTLETPDPQIKSAGACVACHTPPHFTDFGFHNVGISQLHYERVNGFGSFSRLHIPGLKERNENMEKYGSANMRNPEARRLLGSKPTPESSEAADLGMWNVLLSPQFPRLQEDLMTAMRTSLPSIDLDSLSDEEIFDLSVGMMKTPTIRNLGHTAPYFHDGHARGLTEVVSFYIAMSNGARNGILRKPDPRLKKINLLLGDRAPMIKFLKSLNEDYE